MKINNPNLGPTFIALTVMLAGVHSGVAQGTAFTYQGRLTSGTNVANGIYDVTFALFSVSSGAGQVGGTVTNTGVAVSNGLFTVALDFGANFPGADRWLEIAVRTNGNGDFTTLSPRQKITPAPYAITASSLTGTVSTTGLAGTYSNVLTFNNAANSISGSGAGLMALNADQLTSGTVPFAALDNAWKTVGNSGTTPGTQFIGTSDDQPLEFKVNGLRALRLEPNTSGAPNVIGGSPVNFVAPGVFGAVIAGGGATNYFGSPRTNSVSATFGTIGGGTGNTIQTNGGGSTIGGGRFNEIQSDISAVGGGFQNMIEANAGVSTISGGQNNRIQYSAGWSTIGGGTGNAIQTNAGSSTIGGGEFNKIQTNASDSTISGGGNNTVQAAAYYSAIGGGNNNSVAGVFATVPGGSRARAANYGQLAFASGAFFSAGDAQSSVYVLRNTTYATNVTELFLDGSSQRLPVASDSALSFDILVVARSTSTNKVAGYKASGVIKNDGGTTSFVGTPMVTNLGEDVASWDAIVQADDTNDALVVKVTGQASTTIRWVATVRTVEVTN